MLVTSTQSHLHKQFVDSHATSSIRAISQSAQPNSEACEAENCCFRVSMARPHPAVPDPSGVAAACTNISATGQLCGKPVDTTAMGVGTAAALIAGIPQWPDALLMSSTRIVAPRYTLSRPFLPSPGTCPHGLCLRSASPRISMSPLSPPSRPGLVAAASARRGHMAKRAEKIKVDRYSDINFVFFTTGRPQADLDIMPRSSSAPS